MDRSALIGGRMYYSTTIDDSKAAVPRPTRAIRRVTAARS